jgi:DNA polymerase-4
MLWLGGYGLMERNIAHVDLDAFFVAVEQALDPSLKGKPVVVGGSPEGRGVVTSASYEARAFGIHSAMPAAAAKRLCPRVVFLRGNFESYGEYSKRFYGILANHTPAVESVSIDEAYLDLSGLRRLAGPPTDICHRIHHQVREELGLPVSIGLATTRLVAKIASGCAKPKGMLSVLPGHEARFLAPLPIGRLPGIGEKSRPRFEALGLNTIGDLAGMDVRLLKAVFGKSGRSLHLRANGMDPPSDTVEERPVSPKGPPKSIGRNITLGEDTADCSLLKSHLHYLIERAANSLRKEGVLARCVTVRLRYSDFNTITRSLTLPRFTDLDQPLFEAAAHLLERAYTRRVRVRLVGIALQTVHPPDYRPLQLALFPGRDADGENERFRTLVAVVDSIRERYGFNSVVMGRSMFLAKLLKSDPPHTEYDRMSTGGTLLKEPS